MDLPRTYRGSGVVVQERLAVVRPSSRAPHLMARSGLQARLWHFDRRLWHQSGGGFRIHEPRRQSRGYRHQPAVFQSLWRL